MKQVFDEIQAVKTAFGYTAEEAVKWIQFHLREYDSVFKCDFNRFLTGDVVAKQYGVEYE